jgi:hypothetical protein
MDLHGVASHGRVRSGSVGQAKARWASVWYGTPLSIERGVISLAPRLEAKPSEFARQGAVRSIFRASEFPI